MRTDYRVPRSRARRILASSLVLAGASLVIEAGDARAQSSATQKPMPNVMLLVDTSGSMERMPDNSLPSANVGVTAGGLPNACSPGIESNPNRWGMLLQALTGNMQPYFSCAAVDRSSGTAGAAFRNEYKIAGVNPYDTDYFLPYHRPLTGTATTSVCAIGPHRLPGAASGLSGVGPGRLGYAAAAGMGGDVQDFPDDALITARHSYMLAQYGSDSQLAVPLNNTNACIFDQAPDGQLDAARDYVRFGLMTFDNDESYEIGVNSGAWPPQGQVQTGGTLPFLGQWSYRRDASNPLFSNGSLLPGAADGLPMLCAPPRLAFEVGARHYGAPPWEGRMVEFPPQDASLLDIQRVNEQIQKVLLASRPYGATPIDGMMDDARDYFWYHAKGPKRADDYVRTANCRDQFIILLTDGAPNLSLRPSCQGSGGVCPFPDTAAQTAAKLYQGVDGPRVTTFVIGFSVNGSSGTGGDGFPAPYNVPGTNNCKSWYAGVGGTPTQMATACSTAAPAPGSTAEACCLLNEIAYNGTGGATAPMDNPAVGAYFAESQADIVLAFGRILASITKAVATRTVPVSTPTVYTAASFGSGAMTAEYQASFIPNAQKPWSGEILRQRAVCDGTTPSQPAPTPADGDSMAVNLARQGAAQRLFVTMVPDQISSTVVDAARTVRPFVQTTPDGIPVYRGNERSGVDWDLKDAQDMRLALEVDRTTCKRGRVPSGSGTGTVQVPALDLDSGEACTRVVMGFTTGHSSPISESGTVPGGTATYNFNIRCNSATGTPSAGRCSITNDACDVANPDACSGVRGQVCVPDCAPLGAVFRANPVMNGPPDSLLREEGYRTFQARRARRKPTLFAATTDGVLHAFKAMETATNATHELWSFIPPAVLPRLASNYPSGNQILLDGTPVVKDTVWDRTVGEIDNGSKWHTTLVAGLGVAGGGYYAVNVTDSDCSSTANTNECTGTSGYEAPGYGSLDHAGGGAYDGSGSGAKRGPHFLWQLTDFPRSPTGETARVVRRSRDGQDMVSLFGRTTGTPAITTLQIRGTDGVDRQVGVAILPGGIDGQPVRNGQCARVSTDTERAHDSLRPPRQYVRQWASTCDDSVPGRGLTIVRLDTGEIIRHFGRTVDIPRALPTTVVNYAPFDSPVTGTPVVYPQTVGAVAQRVFVGDADGTLWRVDVSSTNPANWRVMLFADLVSGGTAADSQPIQVTPVLSLEPNGAVVINAATGDQENIIYRVGERNYVWSIMEQRPTLSTEPPRASIRWVETLLNGERVTGPMTVFDRTLFFATFAPHIPAPNACDNAGVAKLWGLNYFVGDGAGTPPGGSPMWCDVDPLTGICPAAGSLVKSSAVTGDNAGYIIPGVTLRATQACSAIGAVDDGTGLTGFQTMTPSRYELSFGVSKPRTGGAAGMPPSVQTTHIRRPLPRISTTVNAWALVVD